MTLTSYPTITRGTVEHFFGITSIHETIQEMADDAGAPVDTDLAEEDYRDSLEAYMPPGWYITGDDTVISWPDADPVNITRLRAHVAQCIDCFDISDYVLDALEVLELR
jgi:hypothetical protein